MSKVKAETKFTHELMNHYLLVALRDENPDIIIKLLFNMRNEYHQLQKNRRKKCPDLNDFFDKTCPRALRDDGYVGLNLEMGYGNIMVSNHMYALVSERVKEGERLGNIYNYRLKNGFEGIFLLDESNRDVFIRVL